MSDQHYRRHDDRDHEPHRWDAGGDHQHGHAHSHGAVDPAILTTGRGIWAVKVSFAALIATAVAQVFVVVLSGSVALLADTIHNFGDAGTAIPLWLAFALARRRPSPRFTYGYGRVEDLAGVAVVAIILFSAIVAGYESVQRLLHPRAISSLGVVAGAALVGFLGNEMVAIYRLRVGKEIGSAALVADGYHARVDGLTSLAVLGGAIGVWLGFPLADPLVGLGITLAIARIVWQSARLVFTRMLDGVDPEVVDEVRHAVGHVEGVHEVTETRVRWLGHRLHAEVNVTADPGLSLGDAHELAKQARHELLHHLTYLANAVIHVDPANQSGERHHRVEQHAHGGLVAHSHF